MRRTDLSLLMLALAEGKPYSPVQIQKSLFLATRNLPHLFEDNPPYNFVAYDYGPFDKAVYEDQRELERKGLAVVALAPHGRWNEYRATQGGIEAARELKASLDSDDLEYLKEMSNWVRGLSFSQLVAAIYKAYPEMKENSIFAI